MVRIYFLQQCFNLSDRGLEYDSLAMRRFVGINLGREPVLDETTVWRFRHLLETTLWSSTDKREVQSERSKARTPR